MLWIFKTTNWYKVQVIFDLSIILLFEIILFFYKILKYI